MRVIRKLIADNYRTRHLRFDDLRDVNILIGPNNCGKSSVLEMIGLLNNLSPLDISYDCPTCKDIINRSATPSTGVPSIHGVNCNFQEKAKFLGKGKITLTFEFAKEDVEKCMSKESLEKIERLLGTNPDHVTPNISLYETSGNRLQSKHVYAYDTDTLKQKLFSVLGCPEERLATYKGSDLTQYIRNQKIRANIMLNWVDLAKEIADQKIETYETTSLDFVRKIGDEEFTGAIMEQGSGVRSLICLLADILSQKQARIILIDEPELGLNPAGKQALLRFLIRQSTAKQIFITTHDPTFANPVLWEREKVALFLFSPLAGEFIRVDLGQSIQDPNTFGGFLPHTTSLQKIHLYVEGCFDVYEYQIFLRKFLMEWYPENWFKKLNSIGVFHLGGDCWSHFLYTIPLTPYYALVLLDGDKKKDVENVVQKINEATRLPNKPDRFKLCTKITQLKHRGRPKTGVDVAPVLVYCLEKTEMEDYLEPRPKNKEEGPSNAEKMTVVPDEIQNIFRSLPLESS